jgi:hypothetical protein
MMMRRLVHGVTAALGVLVLAIGVPIVLVKVAGWPLPTKLPDWSNVYWSARQRHVPAEFVIKTLAAVCWLAWAQLMWAMVWELAVNVPRTLRGQRTVAAPWSLGITTRVAQSLVAPLMLLSTFTTSAPAVAAPALADLSSTAWFGPAIGSSAAVVVDLNTPVAPAPRWVVEPGDTLWDVAEQCLGDGSRVDEVLACNPGLVATGRLIIGDSLRLPTDARVPVGRAPRAEPDPVATTASAGDTVATHVVMPGDTLWDIAEHELDDPLRWPEVFAANEGRTFADGRTLSDPDLIHPGWDLTIPGDDSAPPVEEPAELTPPPTDADPLPVVEPVDTIPVTEVPVDTSPVADVVAAPPLAEGSVDAAAPDVSTAPPIAEPVATLPAESPVSQRALEDLRPVNRWSDVAMPAGAPLEPVPPAAGARAADTDEDALDDAHAPTPELLTMERAAMMSAGLLLLLAVRRRQRLRTAPPGARPPAPTPTTAATERALRSIGAGERFARVDLAVRAAAMPLIHHGQRPLAAIVAGDGALELVATGAAELPAPWEGDGARWVLPASVPIEMLAPDARQVAAPTPALIQLGCDGGREVYVDLEALGALQVDAPAEQADAVVAAVATTLATSVLAEVTSLIGVDVPAAAFCGHRLYVAADDVPDGLVHAVEAVGSTVAAGATTFELRARATGGETWEPAVVLVGSAVGEAQLPFVPTGVAVVSAAPIVGPSSVLTPDGDAWELRPAGIRLTPIGLASHEVSAVEELLDVPEVAPVDALTELDEPPTGPSSQSHELLVRLIGPVRIETAAGASVEFERSKTRELVAWLATHRDRSTRTLARTALWEFDVRDATFANVVSEARRALARAVPPPEGEEWVGRTLTEDLPLHELVRTDADLLTHALAAARLAAPGEAIALLRPAVELLAGMPFEGTSYLWPDPEGIASSLVVLATSAAAELAAQCLAVGDVEGVFAATDRGLRVLPGHEELIGLRMQAHARAGDHAGVRHEWESYSRTLVADPWSDGEPSPKLVALRAHLLGVPGRIATDRTE